MANVATTEALQGTPAPSKASPTLDRAQLAALFRAHAATVMRALRRAVDPAVVDDLTQEVFVVAERRWSDRRGGSERAWLVGIARRVAADHRRKRDRTARREQRHAPPPWESGTPEQSAATLESLRFVQAFLDSLAEPSREVFVMAQIEGLSAPEIATALSLSVTAVYSRLHRTRQAFRTAVARRRDS